MKLKTPKDIQTPIRVDPKVLRQTTIAVEASTAFTARGMKAMEDVKVTKKERTAVALHNAFCAEADAVHALE